MVKINTVLIIATAINTNIDMLFPYSVLFNCDCSKVNCCLSNCLADLKSENGDPSLVMVLQKSDHMTNNGKLQILLIAHSTPTQPPPPHKCTCI